MNLAPKLRFGPLLGWAATCVVCAIVQGCGQPVVTPKTDPVNRPVTNGVGVSAGQKSTDNDSPSESVAAATKSSDGTEIKPTDAATDPGKRSDSTANGSPVATVPNPSPGSASKAAVAEFSPPPPRKFKVEGPNGALRVNYDDLDVKKLLNLDNVFPGTAEKLPEWVKALHGKTVRLRGYMKPGFQADDISQFVFARDTGACCFGPNLRFDYLITVTMAADKTTSLRELRPFDVVGKFRIELAQLDDGTIYGLYHIDDATLLDK
ncbi:MAG: hypothetical protein HZA46_12825 [Planctomycetales bacterium]|nr:hypothetical protein [Planctomycetales bacterium]